MVYQKLLSEKRSTTAHPFPRKFVIGKKWEALLTMGAFVEGPTMNAYVEHHKNHVQAEMIYITVIANNKKRNNENDKK